MDALVLISIVPLVASTMDALLHPSTTPLVSTLVTAP